jgi:transposase
MKITTIGLDLAKSFFQVHGIDATGQVVVRKSLRRAQMLPFFAKLPSCLVGIEACGTSHHWARELIKLGPMAHRQQLAIGLLYCARSGRVRVSRARTGIADMVLLARIL